MDCFASKFPNAEFSEVKRNSSYGVTIASCNSAILITEGEGEEVEASHEKCINNS